MYFLIGCYDYVCVGNIRVVSDVLGAMPVDVDTHLGLAGFRLRLLPFGIRGKFAGF